MPKAVRFHEIGGPDVLRLEDCETPTPAPGEALVAIEALGLNRAEAAFRSGHYLVQPKLPSLLGIEATGRILALGEDVEGLQVGERVFSLPTFDQTRYGLCATEALIPATSLAPLPDDIDPVQSAATWVAFFTAWGSLVETGALRKDQYVLITAAAGSVGLAALNVAREVGAIPIATTRNHAKRHALEAAGAAHVISADADLAAEVSTVTGGAGVSLVLDAVAGPFAERLMETLGDHGVMIVYGGLSNQPATFPRQLAIRKNLSMRGYNAQPLLRDPARFASAYAYVLDRLRDGRLAPSIDRVFPLDRIADAYRRLESSDHVGKIVVTTGAAPPH